MRQHFLLDPEIAFLNHGSFGACPIAVLERQQQFRFEIERNPCEFLGRRSGQLLAGARSALAAYLGANPSELMFVENATTGVNIAAHSIELSPGDEVLGTDLEYGACDACWELVCARQGAIYRRCEITLPFQPETFADSMKRACTPSTRVLFLSHVTSSTALILPIAELIAFAHARNIVVVIDGAHAPAFIDLDLNSLGADFYTGNCHKWMCAPKGAGFLHVRAEHHESLDPLVISWGYAVAEDDSPQRLYVGRGTLEERLQWLGTRDPSAFLSVPAALEFLSSNNWPDEREACRALAYETARAVAEMFELDVIAPLSALGPMIALPLPRCDPERLRQALFDRHHIEIPVGRHRDLVLARISVHLHTTRADLSRLMDALPAEVDRAR
jgi:isopenicillin-N epimerase